MTKKLITALAAVAAGVALTAAVGLATPSLAGDVEVGSTKKVVKNNGTVKVTTKNAASGGGHTTATKTTTATKPNGSTTNSSTAGTKPISRQSE
jgi:hypothetical protein